MIPKQLGQNWPELHQRFFFLSEAALNNCPFILAGSVSQFHKVSFCSLRDPPCMWDVCKWTQWAGCQCGWGTFRCFHWQSVVKKGEQEGRLLFSAEDTGSWIFLSFSFFYYLIEQYLTRVCFWDFEESDLLCPELCEGRPESRFCPVQEEYNGVLRQKTLTAPLYIVKFPQELEWWPCKSRGSGQLLLLLPVHLDHSITLGFEKQQTPLSTALTTFSDPPISFYKGLSATQAPFLATSSVSAALYWHIGGVYTGSLPRDLKWGSLASIRRISALNI